MEPNQGTCLSRLLTAGVAVSLAGSAGAAGIPEPDLVMYDLILTNVTRYYMEVSPALSATPLINSHRDTNANGIGPYFYRLRLGP